MARILDDTADRLLIEARTNCPQRQTARVVVHLAARHALEEGALRPVWESDPITEDPIAINRGTVDAELADQVITVLREKANKPALVEAGICTSEEDCELPEETEYGYLPVSDKDFDPIRDICRVTDAEACRNVG